MKKKKSSVKFLMSTFNKLNFNRDHHDHELGKEMPPKSIAILGGGLTGLSSAFHLSRRFPTTKITLIEKQARLGGWVRSERIKIPIINENISMLLEAGPRTLRPNSKSVLELVMSILKNKKRIGSN